MNKFLINVPIKQKIMFDCAVKLYTFLLPVKMFPISKKTNSKIWIYKIYTKTVSIETVKYKTFI